jgi:hypothetical protein
LWWLGERAVTLRNDAAGGPRYVAYHWAVLLATPFLLLTFNPNSFINPNGNGYIDPWVYTGFFLSLPDFLIVYGGSYYSTRLSWLLPGYAVHQVFSPLVANYILHIGFFYILLAAVYGLITAGVNRTTAFVVTLLVAWNPQVIGSMSWDYVDGAVITYFTVTLLCLEKASSSVRHSMRWAVASGAAMACMVIANLVAATLVPICCLFLMLRVSVARWRTTTAILLVAAAGAVATLAVFSHTNWQLGGRWLFLAPSFDYATTAMWQPSPWDVTGVSWLADAHFLLLQAVASLAAILALASRRRNLDSFAGIVQLIFLVAAGWWVIHSTLWTHSIHVSYYTSYLVPLGLIALALIPDSPLVSLASLRTRDAVTVELATLAALISAHLLVFRWGDLSWSAASRALVAAFPDVQPINAISAFAVCAIALVLIRFVRSRWLQWPAFVLTLWVVCGSLPTYFVTAAAPHVTADFATVVAAHRYLWEHLDNNRKLSMWYALASDEKRPLRSIASTYLWAWRLVNENLPMLSEKEVTDMLARDGQLVLLVPDPGDADVAKRALRKFDYDYTPREQKQFGPANASFWVVVGDLSRIEKSE